MKISSFLPLCALSTVLLVARTASGQSASFTYHGRLTTSGAPAGGQYEMIFAILGESSATPVTPPQTNVVPVAAGLFMVPLPATTDVFNGARRFLQISVRTNGSVGPFTVLSPIQEVTSAPYATRAAVADTANVATSVNYQSIGPDHILAAGLPGPGKVLLDNGSAWVWTNLSTASAAWLLGGNAGTAGSNFFGTSDAQPLNLGVNGQQALRIEAGSNGVPNVIAGSARNAATPGVSGAAIAGGGSALLSNVVSGNFGSIGGGMGNRASELSVVSGGDGNTARGDHAFIGGGFLNDIAAGVDSYYFGTVPASSSLIGGGEQNQILSVYSVIAGGSLNFVGTNAGDTFLGGGFENAILPGAYFSTLGGGSGNTVDGGAEFGLLGGGEENRIGSNATHSVLGGGYENLVSGVCAMVLGGRFNTAAGRASLAAGEFAHAAHPGVFVWASGTTSDFTSTAANQFLIRAAGGVGVGTNNPQAQLHVRGTNMADVFKGAFVGNGAGLTNLPVTAPNPGTAYVNSNQTFIGANTFNGAITATNSANQFAGTFTGNAAALSNFNAARLTGIVPDAQLPANFARLGSNQTFTASNAFSGVVQATNNANQFNGAFNGTFVGAYTGNGSGLSGLNASAIPSGTLADARLSTNVALLNTHQMFGGSNIFKGVVAATNAANNFNGAFTGTFTGNGGGLSNLPAATLPTNVAFLNSNQTFSVSNSFAGVVTATNASNQINGRFSGDGTALNLSNAINTAALQNNSITAAKIVSGQVVKTLNGLTDAVTLSAGANVTITPGGNTLTIASSGGGSATNAWNLVGNAGANPTNGQFIGTTDNLPLELRVNAARALRLEPNTNGAPNVIGGAGVNFAAAGVAGAVIGGGGATGFGGIGWTNSVSADFGTIGGGRQNAVQTNAGDSTIGGGLRNTIEASSGTIAGGTRNSIQTFGATIGGGNQNTIQSNAYWSTIAGGYQNTNQTGAYVSVIGGGVHNIIQADGSVIDGGFANIIQTNGSLSVIGGGTLNTNTGNYGVVPGGDQNVAGANSLAAGHRAKATHQGTFVWADSTEADFPSTTNNQFSVRANGGVRFVTGGGGATLNGQSILAGAVGAGQLSGPYTNAITFSNPGNNFIGNGSGLIGVNAGTLNGLDATKFWKLSGNGGTTPNDFLGTTDTQPLEFRVNSVRTMRMEASGASPNLIGGYAGNRASIGVVGVTVGGGGVSSGTNWIGSDYGLIGGGRNNSIEGSSSPYSVIAGGINNFIQNFSTGAAIGGGMNNRLLQLGSYGVIAGGALNIMTNFTEGCVIGGGEGNKIENTADSTIAGGFQNYINDSDYGGVTIGGGNANTNRSPVGTIGGGTTNTIDSGNPGATIGGGAFNWIRTNVAPYATIPGGYSNVVAGAYGLAAGRRAKAIHTGSFVWADSQDAEFSSGASNQVAFRCSSGVLFTSGNISNSNQRVSWFPGSALWSFSSDRNLKEHVASLDAQAVLRKLAVLPISEWSYIGYPQRHIGPMAQDFHAAFPLNNNDKMIDSGDLQGVALAAIQGLNQKVDETAKKKDSEVAALRKQNAALEDRVAELERLVRNLVQTQAGR